MYKRQEKSGASMKPPKRQESRASLTLMECWSQGVGPSGHQHCLEAHQVTIRNYSVLTEVMNAQEHGMLSSLFSTKPMTALTFHNTSLPYLVLQTNHFWKHQQIQEKFPQIKDYKSLHFEMTESFIMVGECKEWGTEIHNPAYFQF